MGMQPGVNSGAGGNPSNPPFAKGGLLGVCANARRFHHYPAPPPTVIPAQAGIQSPGCPRRVEMTGAWIPAFAGMTIRLRGKNGVARRSRTLPHPTLSRWERAFRWGGGLGFVVMAWGGFRGNVRVS